jgi:hypothetical protein
VKYATIPNSFANSNSDFQYRQAIASNSDGLANAIWAAAVASTAICAAVPA